MNSQGGSFPLWISQDKVPPAFACEPVRSYNTDTEEISMCLSVSGNISDPLFKYALTYISKSPVNGNGFTSPMKVAVGVHGTSYSVPAVSPVVCLSNHF